MSAITILLAALAFSPGSNGPAVNGLAPNNPDAIVDLRVASSASLVGAVWKTYSLDLEDVKFPAPGPEKKPTGAPRATRDVAPKATAAGFDDSAFEIIGADTLEERRSTGRFAGQWFRLHLRLPETLGHVAVDGSVVVLEVTVDDYAELSLDGPVSVVLGKKDGGPISGWNAPQHLVLTKDARAGQEFAVTILAMNGPLSSPPENWVWFRSATLEVYRPERWRHAEDVALEVVRLDDRLDAVVAKDARLERIATGFSFTEGPCALQNGDLLFSDPNRNVIHRWSEDEGVSVYRTKSGYTGLDIGEYRQPGSNGLALDPQGRLTICEHGNRRVTRLEKNGLLTVLADRFDGKRLNSPNDLVYRSDGALFFTDPPFGLPKFADDPRREQDAFGVFCLKDGKLARVSTDLIGPNGIAFTPDEKRIYVSDWDDAKKVVMRYDVAADGTFSNGVVFADFTKEPAPEALDGLEVDRAGNLFVSGPLGVWIVAADGTRLGRLVTPELPANFEWANAEKSVLFLAARTGVYRLALRPEVRAG